VSERINAAIAAQNTGNTDTADQIINQTVIKLGGDSEAYVLVADQLLKLGRPTDAARLLVAATQKDAIDWDPRLWASLSKAYEQAGDTEKATAAREEAARHSDAVLKEIGRITPGKSPQAQAAAERFLQLGRYYVNIANDTPKGIQSLREAYRLQPDNVIIQNDLGYTLADKGQTPQEFAEARQLTEAAMKKVPDDGIILDSFGWALYKTGDIAGARRVLREAADDAPDIAEIRYHLAMVYRDLGMKQDAFLEFDRARRMKPDDINIQRDMEAMLTK
jgi:tetratricopeptide (TPR) repeat protein